MILKTLAASMILAAGAAAAGGENWIKHGPFVSTDAVCVQQWDCVPRHPILHSADTRVVTTPSETTTGACAAGTDATNACSGCTAPKPKKQCDWTIEPE